MHDKVKSDENYAYVLLARNLKKYRKALGLTQQQLSDKSLYALSFIKNLESESVYQTASIGTAYKFAQVLGIPLSKLFEETEDKEKTEGKQ